MPAHTLEDELRGIGARLRALRHDAGLSARQVAFRSRFTYWRYLDVEKGRVGMRVATLWQLLREAWGIGLADFFALPARGPGKGRRPQPRRRRLV